MDRSEQKNVLSQFHTRMTLGRNKAQSLQQSFQGLFGVRIEANTNKLTPDNVEAILGNATLVIDCTDNKEAREVIQKFVRANDIPCVHGALAASGDFGRVVWDEVFVADQETGDGATCEDGAHLPFFGIVSAQLAQCVQTFLETGKKVSLQILPSAIVRLA